MSRKLKQILEKAYKSEALTLGQLEDKGLDVSKLRHLSSHLYYGAWDELVKKKTPDDFLKYLKKALDDANKSKNKNYNQQRAINRYPEIIKELEAFIKQNKGNL